MMGNCLGDNTMKIYQGMYFATPMTKCTVQEILDAFEQYTIEVTNETHECFVLDGKSKMRVSHLTVFIAVSEASQRHVTFVTDVGTH